MFDHGALLILEFIVLLVIVYKLHKLEAQLVSLNSKSNLMVSTTLNPLFSEDEIALQKTLPEKYVKKAEWNRKYIHRIEREEILKHHNSGKDKSDFKPSDILKGSILQYEFDIIGIHKTEAISSQMIEANIAILNGKSISEVSDKFYSTQDGIPWRNTNITYDVWNYNKPGIIKRCDDYLLEKTKSWQSNWDKYITGSGLFEEE